MPMTPDEVVKVLDIYQDDAERVLRNLKYDRDRKAGDWTESKNDLISGAEKHKEALACAITLIQDYQKLRERVEGIEGVILKKIPLTMFGNKEGEKEWKIFSKNLSQSIVTYLQQPTEH